MKNNRDFSVKGSVLPIILIIVVFPVLIILAIKWGNRGIPIDNTQTSTQVVNKPTILPTSQAQPVAESTNQDIETSLQELNTDGFTVDSAINDRPIDVMSE